MNIRTLTDREDVPSQNVNGKGAPSQLQEELPPPAPETVKNSGRGNERESFLAKVLKALVNFY